MESSIKRSRFCTTAAAEQEGITTAVLYLGDNAELTVESNILNGFPHKCQLLFFKKEQTKSPSQADPANKLFKP